MWYNIVHLAYTHLHLVRNLQVVHGRTVRSISTHVKNVVLQLCNNLLYRTLSSC